MKKQTIILAVVGLALAIGAGVTAWRESSRAAPQANQTLRRAPTEATSLGGGGSGVAEALRVLWASSWPDVQGRAVSLQTYQGKLLVVNFWATWCAPCVEEMPALDALARAMPEVQFLGVGIDTAKNIEGFVAKISISYPLLVAGHSAIPLVQQLGNSAGGLPFTVVIDEKGDIAATFLGQLNPDDLSKKIVTLSKK